MFDFTGRYQVSNKGRVRALNYNHTGKTNLLKPRTTTSKSMGVYFSVTLSKNGQKHQFLVHRLVATAFIPNPENKPFVNHIDENPSNNSVDNLEWVTHLENMKHGTVGKRISEAVKGKPKTEEHKRKISQAMKKS